MSGKTTSAPPLFFETPKAFRAWLSKNSKTASDLIVGFYKVGSGKPSISWPESVDEALCVGWIDGVRKRIDDESYLIRFSPRRERSIWSAINIAKVAALTAQGRMKPAGLAAFEQRTECRSRVYSFERKQPPELTPQELKQFKKDKAAWQYLQALPPGYRRTITHWVVSAKRAETRASRLERFVASCAAGERIEL
jgi:uncharacterized protein YdeI (YjbR/CyaY-like superfamily)